MIFEIEIDFKLILEFDLNLQLLDDHQGALVVKWIIKYCTWDMHPHKIIKLLPKSYARCSSSSSSFAFSSLSLHDTCNNCSGTQEIPSAKELMREATREFLLSFSSRRRRRRGRRTGRPGYSDNFFFFSEDNLTASSSPSSRSSHLKVQLLLLFLLLFSCFSTSLSRLLPRFEILNLSPLKGE